MTKGRRGISLFEAIAALTIVGMTSVSALAAVGAGFRTAARARHVLEAEALVTQRIDALDLLTDQELQSLPDSVSGGRFDAPLDQYAWETTAAPHSEQAGVYHITIDITWPDGSYAVHTYIYRRPIVATRR
jgi:type II secretory pathway pseudopilin PulG